MEQAKLLERYENNLPILRKIAVQRLANAADVEDALQDAFIKAWQNCGRLRQDGACDAWLRRICVNICMDYGRRAGRRRETLMADLEKDAIMDDGLDGLWIGSALEALTVNARRAVKGFYLQGASVRELARQLNRPEGTIKGWLYQARQRMRELA